MMEISERFTCVFEASNKIQIWLLAYVVAGAAG